MTDIQPRDLTAKLERIATYEQRFRKTPVTAFLRWVGHTRAFATTYRRIGPLIDPWLSRITQGELAARVYGIPALLLTTTGARTGRVRVSPLLYVRRGQGFAVIGTNFGQPHHPAWTTNLLSHPKAAIEVGPVRLTVSAELVDETARHQLLAQFVEIYPGIIDYQQRCAPRVPRIFLLHPTA